MGEGILAHFRALHIEYFTSSIHVLIGDIVPEVLVDGEA